MWSWTSHLLQVYEPVFSSINEVSIFFTSRIVLRNKNFREVFNNGGETQTSGSHIALMLFAIRCRAVALVRLQFLKRTDQNRVTLHPCPTHLDRVREPSIPTPGPLVLADRPSLLSKIHPCPLHPLLSHRLSPLPSLSSYSLVAPHPYTFQELPLQLSLPAQKL